MHFIILLGPKHSGKTSAGKALAALLSCDFVDLDELITERSGKTPRVLYNEGPEIFRKAETEALAALFNSETPSPLVIAAGGGLIDNPDALPLFEHNTDAVSVFLDVCAETAWERIKAAGDLPPFLKPENPEKTHRSLHEHRAAAYRQFASLVLNADGKTPEEIALKIMNMGIG
jgi:shikimate kinase